MYSVILALSIAAVGVEGIPKNDLITTDTCPPHEQYDPCLLPDCGPTSCNCTGGCKCNEGYFRTENEECVLCPDNERYSTCVRDLCRPKTCSDLGKPLNCSTYTRETPCGDGGCVCKDFFIRNDKGKCVPERTCPTPRCPENEAYVSCVDGNCSPKQCKDFGVNMPCSMIDGYCPGGCICKRAHLRHQGVCIPWETCPNVCPAQHSHFTPCMPNCGYTACDQLRYSLYSDCVPTEPGSVYCRAGCVCEDGYLFDANRRCVRREQCVAEKPGHTGYGHP